MNDNCPHCGSGATGGSGRYWECGSWKKTTGRMYRSDVCLLLQEVAELKAALAERDAILNAAVGRTEQTLAEVNVTLRKALAATERERDEAREAAREIIRWMCHEAQQKIFRKRWPWLESEEHA